MTSRRLEELMSIPNSADGVLIYRRRGPMSSAASCIRPCIFREHPAGCIIERCHNSQNRFLQNVLVIASERPFQVVEFSRLAAQLNTCPPFSTRNLLRRWPSAPCHGHPPNQEADQKTSIAYAGRETDSTQRALWEPRFAAQHVSCATASHFSLPAKRGPSYGAAG